MFDSPEIGRRAVSECSESNGEGEIRTPATLAGRPVFETGAFNHSATSPGAGHYDRKMRGGGQTLAGAEWGRSGSGSGLRQRLADQLAAVVGKAHVAAVEVVGQLV